MTVLPCGVTAVSQVTVNATMPTLDAARFPYERVEFHGILLDVDVKYVLTQGSTRNQGESDMETIELDFDLQQYDHPPSLKALYEDDDCAVWAEVSFRYVECDYGVPGSPSWKEAEDMTVVAYEINGVDYTPETLIKRWGDTVEKEMRDFCIAKVDREMENME